MKVGTVMKREVVSVSQEATFGEALALMVERRVGLLPVLEAEHRLTGVLSLREAMNVVLPDPSPFSGRTIIEGWLASHPPRPAKFPAKTKA